jgi:hypothetical protein
MESLNGERTLDPKMAIQEAIKNLDEIVTGGGKRLLMEVTCASPVASLSSFESKMKLVEPDKQHPLVDLSIK